MGAWDNILKECIVLNSLTFNIEINPGATYFFSDVLSGNIIEKHYFEANHNNTLCVNKLISGIYQLTVIDGENVYNAKFEKK